MSRSRKSASRARPSTKSWTTTVKSDTLDGRPRGRERQRRSGSFAALFSRLRRLELVMLHTHGSIDISQGMVDNLLKIMHSTEDAGRRHDQRDEALLPQEGPLDGQAEGEVGANRASDPEGPDADASASKAPFIPKEE